MSQYSLLSEGNSNLILLKTGVHGYVFRLCKRFTSLERNNKYVKENLQFQEEVRKRYDEFSCFLQVQELLVIEKGTGCSTFDDLISILLGREIAVDDDKILLLKIPNCLPKHVLKTESIDYYSKVYNDKLLECKPKWNLMTLHDLKTFANYISVDQSRDSRVAVCRNCINSERKSNKALNFCYHGCKGHHWINKYPNMHSYLKDPKNIILRIYELQRKLHFIVTDKNNESMFLVNFLIALRDVTLFIDLVTHEAVIIDLDYKNIATKDDFFRKMEKEWKLITYISEKL